MRRGGTRRQTENQPTNDEDAKHDRWQCDEPESRDPRPGHLLSRAGAVSPIQLGGEDTRKAGKAVRGRTVESGRESVVEGGKVREGGQRARVCDERPWNARRREEHGPREQT
ncbi:hypothetical protein QLX08_001522 [Tetragonisca angustula]|uniref:Uncharacterized protein n=1 Tax=Tetragonisca angustula TaxID=166442 RepID=A0AAW1AF63_9HYME